MELIYHILEFFNTQMAMPKPYGPYHLIWLALVIALTVVLCTRFRHVSEEHIRGAIFGTAVLVTVLEIYKQINYSFHLDNGSITFDYQWYAFPWQFCSTPMYVGLLTGLFRKGKIHDALCTYLATYSVFAGICVMIYPGDVFSGTAGINFQTMVCHGSMIVIGIWLLATGYVRPDMAKIKGAAAVFTGAVLLAVIMNELAFYSGLTAHETFNMFFISRHCAPSLPVYSLVQQLVSYPWCLIIYVAAFTLASGLIMGAAVGIRALVIRRRTLQTTS